MTYAVVAYVFAAIIWIVYLFSLANRERSARARRHMDSA
jgi:hypothetical protein